MAFHVNSTSSDKFHRPISNLALVLRLSLFW